MAPYTPPTRDILFAINQLAELGSVNSLPVFQHATEDMVNTLVEEAAKYFAEVLAPTNQLGDQQGVSLCESGVLTPKEFVSAYGQLLENGWLSLSFPEEEGGFGFPGLVEMALVEMMQTANMAFSMCPLLASGVGRVLRFHGTDELKALYLPKIASGEWSVAMSLTEPQSGSDLSGLQTRAIPGPNHYRIFGQKIFITWADHDMSENILHLVLARIPDAPPGSRGLSLFLVPKYVPDNNGLPGLRNDVKVVSIEHKLGLRASATCTVNYGDEDGAIGYLVGKEHRGLSAMFILMNHARIQVGLQGASLTERAYQMALEYAHERKQGSIKTSQGVQGPVSIIRHPDVRRMLSQMKAGKDAIKALGYVAAAGLDMSEHAELAEDREFYAARTALLTPIIKGWSTELSQELVQLAVQIYGGMGYIEETGVTQFMRDARVITIYEGSSAMQAMDLVNRKLLGDEGKAFFRVLEEMQSVATELGGVEELQNMARLFDMAVRQLSETVEWLLEYHNQDTLSLQAIAFDFMMLSGYVMGGWQMARTALIASHGMGTNPGDTAFFTDKVATSQFYMAFLLPRAQTHLQVVRGGGGSVLTFLPDGQVA